MRNSIKSPKLGSPARSLVVPLVLLLVVVGAWWAVVHRPTPPSPQPPVPPQPIVEPGNAAARAEFFRREVAPRLAEQREANREAIAACVSRIDESFAKYARGIEPFCEDMTSLGTRFGILTRMPAAWWYADERVNAYVQGKLAQHLFNEEELARDLESALTTLREELLANRSRFLSSVKTAVAAADDLEIVLPDYTALNQQVLADLERLAGKRGRDSVYNGVACLIAGEVAGLLVERLVAQVVTAVGARSAAVAATGGGAMAAGGAAGAGGGTAAGPWGTAIGLAGGLVVGAIIDYFMTEHFKAKLAEELQGYLASLRDGIVDGADGAPGLTEALEAVCRDMEQSQEQVMRQFLLGES